MHLGVTEAGDGEDGRIKSAIGIGSLLNDGIGDTIRVSLTEDSVHEIPVARALVGLYAAGGGNSADDFVSHDPVSPSFDPFSYRRRNSTHLRLGDVALGLGEVPRVVVRQATLDKIVHKLDRMGDFQPEIVYEQAGVREVDPRDLAGIERLNREEGSFLVTVADGVDLPVVAAFRLLAAPRGRTPPDPPQGHAQPLGGFAKRFPAHECSWRRPTSARCCATASATPC